MERAARWAVGEGEGRGAVNGRVCYIGGDLNVLLLLITYKSSKLDEGMHTAQNAHIRGDARTIGQIQLMHIAQRAHIRDAFTTSQIQIIDVV